MLTSAIAVRRAGRIRSALSGSGPRGRPSSASGLPGRQRPLAAALILGLLLGLLQLAAAPAVAAADGYQMSASTTYTMNPEAGRLDVTISVTFKNTTPSKGSTYYYYDTVTLSFEHTATALKATADVGSASISRLRTVNPWYDVYRVRLGSPILYGVTRRVTVTYQLPSGAPRSDSPIRVGQAYANFCVIAHGVDSGSLTVSTPDRFSMAPTEGSRVLTSTKEGGRTTFRSGTLSNPDGFWSCLTGSDASRYATSTVSSPSGRQIVVQAWPEDPAWRDQVSAEITQAVVALEKLLGRTLPGTGPINVREVSTAGLRGYAGGFNYLTNIAQISEDIEPGVVAHELAHAWFNRGLFRDTWLSEGSAGWAEAQVGADPCEDPGPPPGTATLSQWKYINPLAVSETVPAVRYQYDLSCFVVSGAAGQVGLDRIDDVYASLLDGLIAYQARDGGLKRGAGTVGWREWVDALDELGLYPAGKTAAIDSIKDQLLKTGVITATDAGLFLPRADARTKYHALVTKLGTDWKVAEAILRALADWRFIDATAGITSAESTWAAVNDTARILPEANPLAGPVREQFETARSTSELQAAQRRATDQKTAAELVAGARARAAAPRPDVQKLGLTGNDLAAPLRDAVAAVTAADLEKANPAVAAIDKTLADEAAAAASMVAARDRLDAPRDPLTSIGLLGTDLQPTFASGVAAVVALDPGAAAAAASSIDAALGAASQQGLIRLGIAVGALVLVLLIVYLVRRWRRRRRLPAMTPALAVSAASAAGAVGSTVAPEADRLEVATERIVDPAPDRPLDAAVEPTAGPAEGPAPPLDGPAAEPA